MKPERHTTPSRASATSRSTRGTSTPTRLPRHLRALPAMKTVSTLLGFIRLRTAPGALLSGQTLSRSALSSTMSASLPGVSVATLRSIHADRNAVVDECSGEGGAGELQALVRVEDLRLAVTGHRILKRLDAECRFHRDRQPPRQYATAEPIEHDGQIDEAARHRDVRDVHRPDLVRPGDLHPAQQVRVDLVAGLGPSWCVDGDRAPLSPSAASAFSHAGGRSCTPRQPAGLSAFASRRRETPGASTAGPRAAISCALACGRGGWHS
jgi:hypothetical protein